MLSGNDGTGQSPFSRVGLQPEAGITTGVPPSRPGGIMRQQVDWLRRVAAAVGLVKKNVRVESTRLANTLLTTNISNDLDKSQRVYDALRLFDGQFLPRELGGSFNTSDGDSPFPENNAHVTLSKEFLESIALRDQFTLLPDGNYISWASFIYLCRCPVVLSLDEGTMGKLLKCISHNPDRISSQVFQQWLQTDAVKQFRSPDLEKSMETLDVMYGGGVLIQRAIMNLRSVFLIQGQDNRSANRGPLASFFNVEYELWAKELIDNHINPEIKKDIPESTFMLSLLRPARAVIKSVEVLARIEASVNSMDNDAVRNEAQQLDLFYANLVHGAAVRVPMSDVWAPDQVKFIFRKLSQLSFQPSRHPLLVYIS